MDPVQPFLDVIYEYIIALAVCMPRSMAIFSVLPVITRLGLPGLVRSVIAIVISLPVLLSFLNDPASKAAISQTMTIIIVMKEVFLGFLIGIVLSLPFWAAEAAGNILDLLRQAPDAQIQGPRGSDDASVTGTLFSIFLILYFVVVGGLTIIVSLIYTSYDIWPIMQLLPPIEPAATLKLTTLLDAFLKAAFLLAAPMIVFILVAFFILMIIARFAPQTNVFDLSMSFSNVAFFVMLQVYALYIVDYLPNTLAPIKSALDTVKGFFQ